MREAFDTNGTKATFDIFEIVYDRYPLFANSGCHRQSHRVGDMSYYFDYLTHKDLSKVEFPLGTKACGYGFYHGFFEHLIQDNPTAGFTTKTCEYFDNNIRGVAPDICETCYHGSGYGFVYAQADVLTQKSQWSFSNFVNKPLTKCEALSLANESEISQCRQGVYNVIVDWMADEEYDFSYDYETPFEICDSEPTGRQKDCYFEMAQKLDSVSNFNVTNMIKVVKKIKLKYDQEISIRVGVAGLVQHDPKGYKANLLRACQTIYEESLKNSCIIGMVYGSAEHTTHGTRYKNAINFCENQLLSTKEQEFVTPACLVYCQDI